MNLHPCLSCGACCAFFRVSFHWSETLKESHEVPASMTEPISTYQNAMVGTGLAIPVCIALEGIVGQAVSCSIYDHRPSCCRSFNASFEDGIKNERCDRARFGKGLVELQLTDWPLAPEKIN
jgi:Fe-S-cluster containining protein